MQASQSLATENEGSSPADSLDQEPHYLAPQPTLCAGVRLVSEAGCCAPTALQSPLRPAWGQQLRSGWRKQQGWEVCLNEPSPGGGSRGTPKKCQKYLSALRDGDKGDKSRDAMRP